MTTRKISEQISSAIRNDLNLPYSSNNIEKNLNKYIWLQEKNTVIAFVRIENVSWYQCEVKHL